MSALPLAAVDLGSNSFHMVIGREVAGQVALVDRLRDPVRLGAGLGDRGVLSKDTVERALASLERFRQRLIEIPADRVRAVGTHTFRHAKKPKNLLERCGEVLGIPIEILPGPEEARLIYLGVAHALGEESGRRLVVDIGGGSTECVLGEGFTPHLTDSFGMGCVSFSRRFFADGRLTSKAFSEAETAARVELEPVQRGYADSKWNEAVGSSGTIRAVELLIQQLGLDDALTFQGVKKLRKELLRFKNIADLQLPGLAPERAPVLPGGLAILKGLMRSFGIQRMQTSRAALREGVLYDLLGRIRREDVRDHTIRVLSERYHVDQRQAQRVERTAHALLDQVHAAWGLPLQRSRELLSWAAQLHEVGLAVAYSGHHRHGAYLLANSSMSGFSRDEKERLAALVRYHRRKLSTDPFDELPGDEGTYLLNLCVLLRLAVLLHRARSPRRQDRFTLGGRPAAFEIVFPDGWLAEHSLLSADLEAESLALAQVGIQLRAR